MLIDFTQLLLCRSSVSVNSKPEEQVCLSIDRLHVFDEHLQRDVIPQAHVQRKIVKTALVRLITVKFLCTNK